MDEPKEKTKKEEPKQSGSDTEAGVQSETISELDRADQIAERQKRENDRREALLVREEALAARRVVGGQTDAGTQSEPPKEQTPQEYASDVIAGKVKYDKTD